MKIALTGATGFVGRAVLAELNTRRHETRALVRDRAKAGTLKAVMVEGGLENHNALDELVFGVEAVIHVAGAISANDQSDFFAINESGTRNAVDAASRSSVTRFIHISSLAAREPSLSAYAASKRAGEAAVESAGKDIRVLTIRPPVVYGPGDRSALPLFRALVSSPAVLPGSRAQRFSLIYVGDLARMIVAALETTDTGVVEVGDGRPQGYSWEDVAHIASAHERNPITPYFLPRNLLTAAAAIAEPLAKVRGKPSMLSRGKVNELYHTDWVAQGPGLPLIDGVGFVEGFARTVSWYRGAGWLPPRRQRPIKKPQNTRAQ